MRVDRTKVRLLRPAEQGPPEKSVQMTPEEAIALVEKWTL